MAARQTQLQRKREEMRSHSTRLGLLIAAFGEGAEKLEDGNEVNTERIASEITGKYRQYLSDEAGVNWDGPFYADIKSALDAAVERGRRTERSDF